ncbi:MAG TPA: methylenetetrahydrofolate reductase [NAD(P)H] [Candidatus Hydrogenedentes bacterium]|nr:methylenetetrahydrofolate reductase [NAD(P)H] [Candidatus Hydrogenedentota bacterium]
MAHPTLSEIYRQRRLALSFELFPPKTEEGLNNLFQHLKELTGCGPAYITCTYGAGGSTRDRTLQVLTRVMEEYPALPVASHLTCVGASHEDLRGYLRHARDIGIAYIVALRGDPPRGDKTFRPHPDGLQHAIELVSLIRDEFPGFGVAVAGYPEMHPASPSRAADMEHLKRKVDAGADAVITQLFYDNDDFYRFRDRCAQEGIHVPIVPGILPVTSLAQIKRIAALCGASLTPKLMERLEAHPDEEGQFLVGLYHAARQVDELVEHGVPGVHFYVLNKSRAAAFICRALTLSNRG